MYDLSHLHAIELRLSNERERLRHAKTKMEIEMRTVWVRGAEKELEQEKEFLRKRGVVIPAAPTKEELFAELDQIEKDLGIIPIENSIDLTDEELLKELKDMGFE
jgi:hypothetical protein